MHFRYTNQLPNGNDGRNDVDIFSTYSVDSVKQ